MVDFQSLGAYKCQKNMYEPGYYLTPILVSVSPFRTIPNHGGLMLFAAKINVLRFQLIYIFSLLLGHLPVQCMGGGQGSYTGEGDIDYCPG